MGGASSSRIAFSETTKALVFSGEGGSCMFAMLLAQYMHRVDFAIPVRVAPSSKQTPQADQPALATTVASSGVRWSLQNAHYNATDPCHSCMGSERVHARLAPNPPNCPQRACLW